VAFLGLRSSTAMKVSREVPSPCSSTRRGWLEPNDTEQQVMELGQENISLRRQLRDRRAPVPHNLLTLVEHFIEELRRCQKDIKQPASPAFDDLDRRFRHYEECSSTIDLGGGPLRQILRNLQEQGHEGLAEEGAALWQRLAESLSGAAAVASLSSPFEKAPHWPVNAQTKRKDLEEHGSHHDPPAASPRTFQPRTPERRPGSPERSHLIPVDPPQRPHRSKRGPPARSHSSALSVPQRSVHGTSCAVKSKRDGSREESPVGSRHSRGSPISFGQSRIDESRPESVHAPSESSLMDVFTRALASRGTPSRPKGLNSRESSASPPKDTRPTTRVGSLPPPPSLSELRCRRGLDREIPRRSSEGAPGEALREAAAAARDAQGKMQVVAPSLVPTVTVHEDPRSVPMMGATKVTRNARSSSKHT